MINFDKRLVIILALCVVFAGACGIIDGPGDADLKAAAKTALGKQLDNGKLDSAVKKELQTNLEALTASKKGICNVQKEVYNCAVDVTFKMPGAKEADTRTVMIPMKKGSNGWEYVEEK